MKSKWCWGDVLCSGISGLSAISPVQARTLLLVLILLGLTAPLAAAARLESRATTPLPAPNGFAAKSQAVNQCADFLAVTDWTAIVHFSWQDMASGHYQGYLANGTAALHASGRFRLADPQGDGESYMAWYAPLPFEQGVFDIQASERGAVEWPGGTEIYSASAFGRSNGDTVKRLTIYSDCTYKLEFGFGVRDAVITRGAYQYKSGMGGGVQLSDLPISVPAPSQILYGTMDVPFELGGSSGTFFQVVYHDAGDIIYHNRGGFADATVSWTLIPGDAPPCAKRMGPIDASDPALDDPSIGLDIDQDTIPPNKGNTLAPPDPANLTVKVTCAGVPVRNAKVKIEAKAKENSGGHLHANRNIPRPRGYLKGPGAANYTELTEQNKSITVQTDSKGTARVAFRPGTDNATGGGGACAGKQRGIAGTYEVTASLVDPRFNGRQAQGAIQVKRNDFAPLPLPGYHYVRTYHSSIHPEGTWGTQATMGGMQALAVRFYDYQVQHNQALTQSHKTAWPIVNLGIIDISLRDGGLFDSGGTNVCGGGSQVGFVPWQIPHQTHLNGTGVDISTNAVTWPGSQAQRDWWKSALRGLGCSYGTWARESTLHLNVDQGAGNWGQVHSGCQFALPPGAAPQSFAPNAQADAPILFVSVAPAALDEDSYGPAIAAPGQVVSLTIGVNNLSSTTDAHQVVLTATLPSGLQFMNADPPASRMGSPNQPVWNLGVLTTQASLQIFSLAAQVDSSIAPGTVLTMTAQAAASDSGPTPDDHFEQAFLVQPLGPDLVVRAPDLEGAAMTIDQPITATFSVVNQGTAIASSTVLTLTLPPSVTLSSAVPPASTATTNAATWDLGPLAPRASQRLTVTLSIDPALITGIAADPDLETLALLTFMLDAAAPGDFDLTNNTQRVIKPVVFAGSDTGIWIDAQEADVGTPSTSQEITYTILYGNLGNQVAPATWVTVKLSGDLSAFEVAPTPTSVTGGTVLNWNLGDLPGGEGGSLLIHAHGGSILPTKLVTSATIKSAGFDIGPLNNTAIDQRWVAVATSSISSSKVFLPLIVR